MAIPNVRNRLLLAAGAGLLVALASCGGGGSSGGGVPPKVNPPVANFSNTPNNLFEGQVVTFTDQSTGNPTAWEWDFNSDNIVDSTEKNPTHIYAAAGVYDVTLKVTNSGGSDTRFRPAAVTVNANLTADFTGSPLTIIAGNSVTFTDTSPGGPTTWAWDFNADTVVDSTQQNPTHTYLEPGVYDVRLTVTNLAGTDTLVRQSYVTVNPIPGVVVDMDVDSNRDGTVSSGADDDNNEHIWSATQGAVFYYNLDDDDSNNTEDYKDTAVNVGDLDDQARIVVRQCTHLAGGGTVTVTVSSEAQGRVRIFRNQAGNWSSIYATGPSFTLPAATLAVEDIELAIEARDRMSGTWNGLVSLTVEMRNATNVQLGLDTVVLRVAPPIISTNLWLTTQYHVVSIPTGSTNNVAMRAGMQAICTAAGIQYVEVNGPTYSNDRWLQDSSEAGVVILPSATGPRRVVDQVMQLARWRPVDAWCRNLLDPNFDFFERFSTNDGSHNYGGNFEVVPPYNGREWGRVLFGGGTGTLLGTTTVVTERMTQVYRDFFNAAGVQGPFLEATTEWLAVGHIDEYTMFIPAPNRPRGWVCLIASPQRAINVLQTTATAGHGTATVFAGRAGYQTTVNGILGDGALMTLNQQAQARIDQGREQIKAGTNLTDADFIHLPVLFEYVGGSWVAALNPGVVNLVCMPAANGTTYLGIPDPEGPDIGGVDQWQADINAQLAPLATVQNPYSVLYLDVFWSYHDLLGEAHCGSNFVRTPPVMDWWDK